MHIFVKTGGEEKLKGELRKKTKLLNTYLHCLPQKFSRSLCSLDYILFSSLNQEMWNIYGRDGKVRLSFKSGKEKRQFSVPLLIT